MNAIFRRPRRDHPNASEEIPAGWPSGGFRGIEVVCHRFTPSRCHLIAPNNSDKPATQISLDGRDGFVDAPRQGFKIVINFTDDDTRVIRPLLMQGDKMSPIERDNRPRIGCRVSQYLGVGHLNVGAAGFGDRDAIMSEPAQLKDGRERKILVGIKACHRNQASSLALA